MQVNKLKKSLGFLYAIKTSANNPFFFIQEKQDSREQHNSCNFSKSLVAAFFNFSLFSKLKLKYPVRITFFSTLQDFLLTEVVPVFISFKEFAIIQNVEVIKLSLFGVNLFCNTEDFLKQDKEFVVYEQVQVLRT